MQRPDHALTPAQGRLHGILQAHAHLVIHHQSVHDGFDGVGLFRVQFHADIRIGEFNHFTVHARANETFERHLTKASTEQVLVMGQTERDRIFNLGYFTWVEQRGVSPADFEARRDPAFWRGLHSLLPAWDELITAFNHGSGAA